MGSRIVKHQSKMYVEEEVAPKALPVKVAKKQSVKKADKVHGKSTLPLKK